MGRFDGKVTLITGAARGQGQSHAINFAKEGSNLIISDIAQTPKVSPYPLGTSEELENTTNQCRELGVKVVSMVCDITVDSQVKAMVDAGIKELGRIDIVINNAAWARMGPLDELSEEDIVSQIDVTLIGAIRVCKHVIPHMKKQQEGCIINISSTGIRGFVNFCPYNCAKHAMLGLTKGLALELGPYNIRVNTVIPGIVGTGMIKGLAPKLGMDPEEAIKTFVDATRILPDAEVKPQNTSNACMYLASEPVLTGTEILVDAGHMLK